MAVSLVIGTMMKMLEDTARWLTSRLLSAFLIAALAPAASAAPAVPAALSCQVTTLNDEQANAACALPALLAGKDVRFKAHFLGSHDDTKVSFKSLLLGDVSVACREGSKTASTFEDGDVTLDCAFRLPATLPEQLKVQIAMHHLQLDRTELVAE